MSRNPRWLNLLLRFRPRSFAGWVVLGTVGVVYLMVAPTLGRTLGVDLPGLGDVFTEQSESAGPDVVGSRDADRRDTRTSRESTESSGGILTVGGVVDATQSGESATAEPKQKPATKPDAKQPKQQLGVLKEISPKVFETTAGLVYAPGSVDRHRLLHVMKHAKDDPDKPVHGVFDPGDERAVFAAVDEAYLIADLRGPPQARKETQRDRTIWTVDMKRTVGYLGGQSGKRKGNPKLTGIKLVLEGRNVITAFPVEIRGRR